MLNTIVARSFLFNLLNVVAVMLDVGGVFVKSRGNSAKNWSDKGDTLEDDEDSSSIFLNISKKDWWFCTTWRSFWTRDSLEQSKVPFFVLVLDTSASMISFFVIDDSSQMGATYVGSGLTGKIFGGDFFSFFHMQASVECYDHCRKTSMTTKRSNHYFYLVFAS